MVCIKLHKRDPIRDISDWRPPDSDRDGTQPAYNSVVEFFFYSAALVSHPNFKRSLGKLFETTALEKIAY